MQAIESECCPGVVDPFTLLGVLGGIAGLTLGLRQLVIDNIMMARRRRRSVEGPEISQGILEGGSVLQADICLFCHKQANKNTFIYKEKIGFT